MTPTNSDFFEVLSRVSAWSPDVQLALAHRVLRNVDSPTISQPARTLKLEEVIGLLRTNAPPPSDEQCDAIVQEERMRKHG